MPIEDVTRDGVVEAMAEHDLLGEEEFLHSYGFRQARNHFVLFNGKAYSSKAVLGVGHKYSGAGWLPLRWDEFYGGAPTVNRLRALGFTEFTSDPDQADAYVEGERQSRETTFFTRNAQLARDARAYHGTICQTCGFDFGAVYGELGAGYIECHHLNPLGEQGGNAQEVTVREVAVLCSNCHRIIHHRRPALSIELLAEHPERGEFSCAGRVHLAGSGRGGPVVDDTDDLIDGERDDAEHEMAFDLECAADAEKSGAELVFQTGVDAFGHGAEIVDQVVEVGPVDELQALDFAAPFGLGLVVGAKVAVDDRGVAQRPALVVDRGGVVGGVHEIVEIGDAGAGHGHQGNGDLAVVDGGRGQHAGDWDLAAGHVDVEFVPGPGLFVALAVFLAADVAGGGQVGEHLAEVLRDLPLETRRLRPRTLFALAWTSALARRRGIIGRRGIVFAVVGRVLDRLLARFDLGGVARDRPDDASPERTLDQRGVDLVWQRAAREFGERPGKRGFGRHLRASLPAEDATQGLVDVEALDQGAGGGNAQDRLGHESSGEGAAVLGRPARPPGRLRNERFEADHVERGDETAQRFGDRIVVLAHPREQKALDVAPASLHRVERVVCHVYSHG